MNPTRNSLVSRPNKRGRMLVIHTHVATFLLAWGALQPVSARPELRKGDATRERSRGVRGEGSDEERSALAIAHHSARFASRYEL